MSQRGALGKEDAARRDIILKLRGEVPKELLERTRKVEQDIYLESLAGGRPEEKRDRPVWHGRQRLHVESRG
jgi:hypothetical protein